MTYAKRLSLSAVLRSLLRFLPILPACFFYYARTYYIRERFIRHHPTLKCEPFWETLVTRNCLVIHYWMTTFFCCVFTPPWEFCAVTVMTLSPGASGGVK